MKAKPRHRRRVIDWTTTASWLLVALLLHGALFVLLYFSGGEAHQPEPITIVSLTPEKNPFRPPPEIKEQAPPSATRPLAPPVEPIEVPALEDLLLPAEPETATPGAAAEQPTAGKKGRLHAAPGATVSPTLSAAGPRLRYANRRGRARERALARFGGDARTESVVRLGLEWLARHQRRDGAWDRRNFDQLCPDIDRCREQAVELTRLSAEPAVTGLALLAFMGAGHTHIHGDFQTEVAAGLEFLLSVQRRDGSFAERNTLQMYNHAIATLTLAEAYALTGDPGLRTPLSMALGFLVRAQQPGGGWGYTDELSINRNDMSVTGWSVMALSAGKAAGARIPDRTIIDLIGYVDGSTLGDGHVIYAREGESRIIQNATGSKDPLFSPAVTAIGMLIRQLLGYQRDAPILRQQQKLLLAETPSLLLRNGPDRTDFHSNYYWYYGSLAMFHQGGDGWQTWNGKLVKVLLQVQNRSIDARGRRRHMYGSFPAFGRGWGKWGRVGSRIYSTALSVLMLETYYRYVPAYLAGDGLITEHVLRAGLADNNTNRRALVSAATYVHADIGEPALLAALRDPEPAIRLWAAFGLANHGSPVGESLLRSALPGTVGGERAAIQSALAKLENIHWPAKYGEVVRVDEVAGVFVFDTQGKPVYLGQVVLVQRTHKSTIQAKVTRRSTGAALAAAELLNKNQARTAEALPRTGDLVSLAK